jgi:ankyrin repeat protein
VDARNAKGNSALLICAQRGDVSAVRRLVHLGADPALVNQSRMNAVDLARTLGQEQVLAVLAD